MGNRSTGKSALGFRPASKKGASVTVCPLVCEVKVIPDEVRAPRLSSVQRADGSFVSKPLEDLWPFLEREEFYANMLIPVMDE